LTNTTPQEVSMMGRRVFLFMVITGDDHPRLMNRALKRVP